MNYRIIGMRLNRAPAAPVMAGGTGSPVPDTATIDLEPVTQAGPPAMNTSVTVTDWTPYQLGQICELAPTPVVPAPVAP